MAWFPTCRAPSARAPTPPRRRRKPSIPTRGRSRSLARSSPHARDTPPPPSSNGGTAACSLGGTRPSIGVLKRHLDAILVEPLEDVIAVVSSSGALRGLHPHLVQVVLEALVLLSRGSSVTGQGLVRPGSRGLGGGGSFARVGALGASRAPPAIGHRRGRGLGAGWRGAGAAAGVEEGFASLARVSRRSSRLAGLSLPLARPCSPGGGGLYESGALRSRLGRLEPAKSCAWSAAMSLRVAGSMSASGPTAEVGSAEGVPRVERPMARAELLRKAPRGRRERAKTSGGSKRAGPSRGARVGRSATIEVKMTPTKRWRRSP